MAIVYFPAIVETGPEGGYGVFFPDLPGCVSAGDSLQEAARNAEIALQLHLAGMVEDGETIPDASELDAIERDPDVNEAARILVRGERPSRLERLNITMDEGLLKVVDRAAEHRGMTRSGFLAEGARQLIGSSMFPLQGGRYVTGASHDPMRPRVRLGGAVTTQRADKGSSGRVTGKKLSRDSATGRYAGRSLSSKSKGATRPTSKKK
jgi:predicted RNase H-like HicB family nuclease